MKLAKLGRYPSLYLKYFICENCFRQWTIEESDKCPWCKSEEKVTRYQEIESIKNYTDTTVFEK